MEKHILCKKDDIAPGDKKVFEIGRLSIVVVRNKDEFYAVRNACPHQGGPLGKGKVMGGAMPSEVGEYCYEKQGEVLYCPWHHWQFDLTSGRSLHDPEGARVKTYEVKVEGDDVVLLK